MVTCARIYQDVDGAVDSLTYGNGDVEGTRSVPVIKPAALLYLVKPAALDEGFHCVASRAFDRSSDARLEHPQSVHRQPGVGPITHLTRQTAKQKLQQ